MLEATVWHTEQLAVFHRRDPHISIEYDSDEEIFEIEVENEDNVGRIQVLERRVEIMKKDRGRLEHHIDILSKEKERLHSQVKKLESENLAHTNYF